MFVLAWSSGHTPPRTMFFMEAGEYWNGTENIVEAKRFKTAVDAINTYKTRCTAWPDYTTYASAIKSGRVRAESLEQGALDWGSNENEITGGGFIPSG